MNTTKALWDLEESKIVSYPRYDNEPVVGLDSRYVIVDLVHETQPTYNPLEEQVLPTTKLDLESLTYTYTWIVEPLPPAPTPEPPQPDYHTFYSTLIISNCYQHILAEVRASKSPTLTNAFILFVTAMQDCLSGRIYPDALQNAIWILLGEVNLDETYSTELQTIFDNAHLTQVYTLTPPEL